MSLSEVRRLRPEERGSGAAEQPLRGGVTRNDDMLDVSRHTLTRPDSPTWPGDATRHVFSVMLFAGGHEPNRLRRRQLATAAQPGAMPRYGSAKRMISWKAGAATSEP